MAVAAVRSLKAKDPAPAATLEAVPPPPTLAERLAEAQRTHPLRMFDISSLPSRLSQF